MKRLLTIVALLAVSTAHAETYVCTTDKQISYEANHNSPYWKAESYNPTNTFFIDSNEKGSMFYYHKANGVYDDRTCAVESQALAKNTLICKNQHGQIRIDRVSKKYIVTEIIQTNTDFHSSSAYFEYGRCKDFKGVLK